MPNFQYRTIGGTSPITFAVTAGSLPAGTTLNPATGAITGTYTTAASGNAWTVTATDANGATATLVEAQYVFGIAGNLPSFSAGALIPDFLQDFATGMADFSLHTGSTAGFTVVSDTYGDCLQAAPGPNVNDAIVQTITEGQFSRIRLKYKVTATAPDDYGVIDFRDSSDATVMGFVSGRQASQDGSRRPSVAFVDDPLGATYPVAATGTTGLWYQFDALYDPDALTFTCTTQNLTTMATSTPVVIDVTARTAISKIVIRTDNAGGSGTTRWDDIEITYNSGQAFAPFQYTESGGVDPVVFTINSGAMPTNLAISSGGLVTLTGSSTPGSYSWVVRGVDDNGIIHLLPDSCVVSA